MKLYVCKYAILIILLLACTQRSAATHIYGGDLRYMHVGGDNYRITLTLYGDCSGGTSIYLPGSSPRVYIQRGNRVVATHYIPEDRSLRENVSPVCAAYKRRTVCDSPMSDLPGAMRYVYSKIVTLEEAPDWKIIFDGTIDTLLGPNDDGTVAGRSGNITNIQNVEGQLMYLVATLDNTGGANSSPDFTSPAIPYFCLNVPQQYNMGAVDGNNDSVVCSLIPALLSNGNVRYIPGYNGEQPMAAAPGTFNYDRGSGQMSFTPDLIQRSLVVIKVDEYKNGKLIGSSMREMTFIVLATCNNIPPEGSLDSTTIVGGVVQGNSINVCVAEPLLKFQIPATDKDGNEVEITVNNVPVGAEVKVVDNGTNNPVLSLEWNTSDVEVGVYNLFVSLTDNACPLSITQTFTYPIKIVNPTSITHEVIRPTGCVGSEISRLIFIEGLMPRIVTISNMEGMVLKTYYDTTGFIIDSFRTGKYIVNSKSLYLKCPSDYKYTVVDSGYFPIPVMFSDRNVCKNDEVIPINISPAQGAKLHWYDLDGNVLHTRPEYNTDSVKTYNWIITQEFDSCTSKPDTLTVTVHDLPTVEILNTNEPLCTGDSVLLIAKGAVRYNWQPDNWISQNGTLAWARVRQPTNFVVTGFTEYNCAGTDTIVMDRLEQCCTFFYPDAFTPNNDGLNDRWAPVTEANADLYLLAIYNRWGERVYYSNNEHDKWDGTHNGRLCDMGTYTYMFRAKCVMGRQETAQGSLLLVR